MNYKLGQLLTKYTIKNCNNYEPVAVGRYGIRKRSDIYKKELSSDYSKNKVIFKDTLIIGMGSVQIDFGVLTEDTYYSVSPAYHTFRVNTKIVLSEYLSILFDAKNYVYTQRYMIASARQGKKVDVERLLNENVEIPDFNKQKETIETINLIKNIILNFKKQIDLFDELITSRFDEMFGKKNYPYVRFEEYMDRCVDIGSNGANAVVMEHYNLTDTKDYAMVIRFTNLNNNDFANDIKYLNKNDYDFFKKSKVYGGEIIFCKIGSAGSSFIMPTLNMPVTLGLNQIMVTPKNVNTLFLYNYINSNEGKEYISKHTQGAVTKTITKHALWDFPILTPPIELQSEFAVFVETVNESKLNIQLQINLMQELLDEKLFSFFRGN